jgi:hypothetical protein
MFVELVQDTIEQCFNRRSEMSTLVKETGIHTVHDEVVSQVAQRWAKALHCRVTIRTGLEQNPWADPKQQSDIAGWKFGPRGDSLEWIAEVETEDSLSDPDTKKKWERTAVPGLPMYLLVPKGTRHAVEKLAASVDVHFTSIYEYGFFNGVVQIV